LRLACGYICDTTQEIPCQDETGLSATIIEWKISSPGMQSQYCSKDFTLADGSPVTPLGGQFEHFYSGKIYTPSRN
jgi:hypothetical protein